MPHKLRKLLDRRVPRLLTKSLGLQALGVVVVLGISFPSIKWFVSAASCSSVADCQQQINNLSSQNASAQQNLNSLESQATSYQDAISRLQQQISGLQQQISTNEATQAQLQQQIKQDQDEITHEKQVLSTDIKAMYVDGQMSTIEELATSKNLSTFVDAQTYRNAVQTKIQTTLAQIATLQAKLKDQEDQITALLQSQQAQQSQLGADQQQQSSLLAMNQSQQDAYNQQIQANAGQIQQLQAQIVALNTPKGSSFTTTGSCGGGYPASATGPYGNWGCNYAKDNTYDVWGMGNRECVSYTAYMVHEEYVQGLSKHDMPNWGGVGDAYEWIRDAQNAGIPVDQNPQPGDIAIRPASGVYGDVGHAMYVKSVSGGQIYVQQYNADLRGDYSEGWRSAAGLYFLHFEQW